MSRHFSEMVTSHLGQCGKLNIIIIIIIVMQNRNRRKKKRRNQGTQ